MNRRGVTTSPPKIELGYKPSYGINIKQFEDENPKWLISGEDAIERSIKSIQKLIKNAK